MGFFNLLETAFFISLAITFVLIMMLVYHFKGRLVILEQKCDTMFEIMNNMIKEMKNIQAIAAANARQSSSPQMAGSPQMSSTFSGGFPTDLLSMLKGNGFSQTPFEYIDENEEGDDEEGDEEGDDEEGDEEGDDEEGDDDEFKKIVVSDTEVDSDDDDEDEKVKVIHVDISEQDVTPEDLPDLEEIEPEESEFEAQSEAADSLDKQVDYKKMDITYLRTLVITRGLASDTKKLKKADLVKLLSDE